MTNDRDGKLFINKSSLLVTGLPGGALAKTGNWSPVIFFICLLNFTPDVMACTVCFGGADSNLARGFTWGIIVLGSLPYLLLTSFICYFIYHNRKNKSKNKEAV